MKYEVSETQLRNLSLFLGRTTLQGNEVQAFNDLMNCFAKPLKEDEKDEKPTFKLVEKDSK